MWVSLKSALMSYRCQLRERKQSSCVKPDCCNAPQQLKRWLLDLVCHNVQIQSSSQPSWHFPCCLKVTTLPQLISLLITNFTTPKYDSISSWKSVQFIGRVNWVALLYTRGLILSTLFRDRIEIPKGNMLNLLTDNKPVILLQSV